MIDLYESTIAQCLRQFSWYLVSRNAHDASDREQARFERETHRMTISGSLVRWVETIASEETGQAFGSYTVRLSTLLALSRLHDDAVQQLNGRYRFWLDEVDRVAPQLQVVRSAAQPDRATGGVR